MKHRRRGARRLPKPGLPPGTIQTDPSSTPTTVRVYGFSPEAFEEIAVSDVGCIAALLERWPVVWVDVEGLRDGEVLKRIAEIFQLHPLAMEDVIDTSQRAKVEPYGDSTFIVAPMPHVLDDEFATEQLSIFLGPKWVVTFQEAVPGDCLDIIRDRIRLKRGRVRSSASAYLAYALLDAVIDGYFPVVERLGERLDQLERNVLDDPKHEQIIELRAIKSQLARLRRVVWPMRDATTTMISLDAVFTSELRLYVRDAYDHVVRLMDIIETDRSMASDLLEIHLSAVSAKLGEVNKFLTVIATIFLPLSWIAGIYGMNFTYLPEKDWRYGYPLTMLLMIGCACGLLFYFYRKGWLAPSVFGTKARGRAKDVDASAVESGVDRAKRAARASGPHTPR